MVGVGNRTECSNITVGIISTKCIPCLQLAMPEHETDYWCPKGNPSVAQDVNKRLPGLFTKKKKRKMKSVKKNTRKC